MRPIRLPTLLRVLDKIVTYEKLNEQSPAVENIRKELNKSRNRMKEIILELKRMNLTCVEMKENTEILKSTRWGRKIILSWEKGNIKDIHSILFQNCKPYKYLIEAIKKYGPVDIDTINEKLRDMMTLPTIDSCLTWSITLNVVQYPILSNNIKKRYYYVLDREIAYRDFIKCLIENYNKLSKQKKDVTIELNMLREMVCLELKISRELFRKYLERYYIENPKKVYLYGGPPSLDIGGSMKNKIIRLESKKKIIYIDYQEGINIFGINKKYIRIKR